MVEYVVQYLFTIQMTELFYNQYLTLYCSNQIVSVISLIQAVRIFILTWEDTLGYVRIVLQRFGVNI